MVSVLATGPKVREFKPSRGLCVRVIKINTPSFGGEVKPSAPCRSIYGLLKIPAECDRDTTSAKFKDISRQLY
jgi:hypothetical protein